MVVQGLYHYHWWPTQEIGSTVHVGVQCPWVVLLAATESCCSWGLCSWGTWLTRCSYFYDCPHCSHGVSLVMRVDTKDRGIQVMWKVSWFVNHTNEGIVNTALNHWALSMSILPCLATSRLEWPTYRDPVSKQKRGGGRDKSVWNMGTSVARVPVHDLFWDLSWLELNM